MDWQVLLTILSKRAPRNKSIENGASPFKREVEKELTGREAEPWGIIYFKLYKTQIRVIEPAIETAALMLGTDKSRGYCLEMTCADFLVGANLENEDPMVLLHSMSVLQVSSWRTADGEAA